MQTIERFCDDLNVLTSDVQDLVIVDDAITKFEKVSGAILSRFKKCKILGFGNWKRKNHWPLKYIQTVDELKVFGIFVRNSFQCLLKKNFDYRYDKFRQALIAWSSRSFDSLYQRVDVINIFALTRIFYVASVLPLQKSFIKKVETSIGKFLWSSSGRLLRVSLADIKNCRERGGLGLTCLDSKGKSLLLSQLLRLLKDNDMKTVGHLSIWMGKLLDDFLPHMQAQAAVTNIRRIPSYYETMADILALSRVSDIVTLANWRTVTTKIIYIGHRTSLSDTRVEIEHGSTLTETWRKLYFPCIPSSTRELLYLTIHNKLPTPERLFRVKLVQDPYCETCLDNVGAMFHDRGHYFCDCVLVRDVWESIRAILDNLLPGIASISNLDLITLNFPKYSNDLTAVWLLGRYMEIVWKSVYVNGSRKVQKGKIFGYLKYKYKADQLGARRTLSEIPELT